MVRYTNTRRLNSIRGRERWWCEAENRGRIRSNESKLYLVIILRTGIHKERGKERGDECFWRV